MDTQVHKNNSEKVQRLVGENKLTQALDLLSEISKQTGRPEHNDVIKIMRDLEELESLWKIGQITSGEYRVGKTKISDGILYLNDKVLAPRNKSQSRLKDNNFFKRLSTLLLTFINYCFSLFRIAIRNPWVLFGLFLAILLFVQNQNFYKNSEANEPRKSILTSPPTYYSQMSNYDELSEAESMVNVLGASWVGGSAYAFLETRLEEPFQTDEVFYPDTGGIHSPNFTHGGTIPLAAILNPKTDNLRMFQGRGCAIFFEMESRPEYEERVTIDKIVAVVNNFSSLPAYRPQTFAPIVGFNLFYIEMDSIATFQGNIFEAKYVHGNKIYYYPGNFKINHSKPEQFVVRLNAKTPGIYDFSVYLLLRYRYKKEKLALVQSAKFLFDHLNHISELQYPD